MAFLTASAPVDMTVWDFSNITGGTITRQNPFQYFITGADAATVYQFTGSGLTYNGSGDLTGGTVTGYRVLDAEGDTLLFVSGFSAAATDFAAAIASADATALFEDIFAAGDNTITGSSGDDVLTDSANGDTINAGDGNDLIIATHAGFNTIDGGAGDDTLYIAGEQFGTAFQGGEGTDTAIVDRSQNFILIVGDQGFQNIENLVLTGNAQRNVVATTSDDAVTAGATLRVDGSALGAASRLLALLSAETDGHLDIVAGAGNDRIQGGAVEDSFHLEAGGTERVTGGAGADVFYMGAALDAADRLDGEDGTEPELDVLFLDGDYSAGLTLASRTIQGVERVVLQEGNTYKLTFRDGNVAAGERMSIIGINLSGSQKLIFDGSAETDGDFEIAESAGNDKLTGGAGADQFDMTAGGVDVVNGNGGDDSVLWINRAFDLTSTLSGGDGHDSLQLTTDCSAGVVFTAASLSGFEEVSLSTLYDYDLTFIDANVAAGVTFEIDGAGLGVLDTVTFNGAAETDGFFALIGGDGGDTLTGGAKADTLTGGLGGDLLTGGDAADTYIYVDAEESTSKGYDTVDGFDGNKDLFDVGTVPLARDADVNAGTLSRATFDADLEAVLDGTALGNGNFVIFKPNAGGLAGLTFLVIDQNGSAGYQAGEDLVIELTNASHLAGLDIADFI
jgi:Ca2+-binding RTX toxin-like protein